MRVLVACEFSGVVRDAFAALGHDAWSCDLLPCESKSTLSTGRHYQGDVLDILNDHWDLMVAHPPCNHLSSAGAMFWPEKRSDGRQQAAIDFFMQIVNAPIPRIAIENPAGIMSTVYRRPNQYIHPWQFGHTWMKRTGLWLKNLPKLIPTDVVEPLGYWHDSGGKRRGGKNSKVRVIGGRTAQQSAKTFPGIAAAMAAQWSKP